jgi:hypothetical protein
MSIPKALIGVPKVNVTCAGLPPVFQPTTVVPSVACVEGENIVTKVLPTGDTVTLPIVKGAGVRLAKPSKLSTVTLMPAPATAVWKLAPSVKNVGVALDEVAVNRINRVHVKPNCGRKGETLIGRLPSDWSCRR